MANWKKKEKATYELIKELLPTLADIQWATGKYSSFDASNDKCLVEFKYRYGNYPYTLIEKMKYDSLKDYSAGRGVVYCVEREDGMVHLFNLNRLDKDNWD